MSLADWMRLVITAARWPAARVLANSQFLRPVAQGLICGLAPEKACSISVISSSAMEHVFQGQGHFHSGTLMPSKGGASIPLLMPCLIGIEACSSAHHWGRKLQALGHTVLLMAPQFVKPSVKSNKNDVADAEVFCAHRRSTSTSETPQKTRATAPIPGRPRHRQSPRKASVHAGSSGSARPTTEVRSWIQVVVVL